MIIDDIKFLRCPKMSEARILEYLSISNKEQQFSNFGPCHGLLTQELSSKLNVDLSQVILGSSATSLLLIAAGMNSEAETCSNSKLYCPAFSFFSTFSIARVSNRELVWFDVDDNFLPLIVDELTANDVIFLNVPFGSSDLEKFFSFASACSCHVVIDAAACLPGLIYNKRSLSKMPDNASIIFSLHATKMISCGEGGVLFSNKTRAHRVRKLINFGLDEKRVQQWQCSFNSKMSEFNAAAGLASLDDFGVNASKIMAAKKIAFNIGQKYDLNFFLDVQEPTLTLNIKTSGDSRSLNPLVTMGEDFKRWWSLCCHANKAQHPHSIKYFNQIIGVRFDWTCIDDYFESLCEKAVNNRLGDDFNGLHKA